MLLRCAMFWRLLSDDPSCDRLAVFVRCVACVTTEMSHRSETCASVLLCLMCCLC